MRAQTNCPLLGLGELRPALVTRIAKGLSLKKLLDDVDVFSRETSEHANVVEWISWCHSHPDVQVTELSVPEAVIPGATLCDVRVATGTGRRRQRDDLIYNRNAEIRRRVARGNCVLRLPDGRLLCLTHALKKFTGGMGDEDDDCSGGDDSTWRRYFLRSPEAAERLVLTQKANGEAAHLSARYVDGSFLVCVGSKNVHMVLRQESDIARYADQRYRVAREVAAAVWRLLEAMGEGQRQLLLSFLHHTRLTAVMELLQPDRQSIEDLSKLVEHTLHFIAWAPTLGCDMSYCGCPPELGFELAEMFGMKTVEHSVVTGDVMNELPRVMQEVREGHGYEGKVLYFVDGENNVIGLLKSKTIWYTLMRAIRDILCSGLKKLTLQDFRVKLEGRFRAIQSSRDFDDRFLNSWLSLGLDFAQWLKANPGIKSDSLGVSLPPLWNQFLRSTGRTDRL
ncbi:uncharacterized protein LOC122382292 isoform X5 [Amphibalanus amphitrite]|uniref:uncharacterized protein LOC122382292 isoform X5 n=1 Tax=Amphibalanus amphitrite TaxID=1232801 RepID=UPI001C9244B8|nr:uncharacterized protein LOC122382292 isoform X5 [Amphibalanus amphitrite]